MTYKNFTLEFHKSQKVGGKRVRKHRKRTLKLKETRTRLSGISYGEDDEYTNINLLEEKSRVYTFILRGGQAFTKQTLNGGDRHFLSHHNESQRGRLYKINIPEIANENYVDYIVRVYNCFYTVFQRFWDNDTDGKYRRETGYCENWIDTRLRFIMKDLFGRCRTWYTRKDYINEYEEMKSIDKMWDSALSNLV